MKKLILKILDFCSLPFVFFSAWMLKKIRTIGVQRMPLSKKAMLAIGVFPIRNHYYEPQFDFRNQQVDFSKDRNLTGIDWNDAGQLELLDTFVFAEELSDIATQKPDKLEFYFGNGAYESGDAEYWYQLLRSKKPRRVYEIGSGNSTLMAIKAIKNNVKEEGNYQCEHICVEPYQMPWLEQTGVKVVREKVEDLELSFFSQLEKGDVLFIDSSHMIRPEGDVLFEYLELLPTLKSGVIVHIHDIFSPKNYLKNWIEGEVRLWNEQYLLEAFLTHNSSWKVIGALNYLRHKHYDKLKRVAPFLSEDREPGSFYLQRT